MAELPPINSIVKRRMQNVKAATARHGPKLLYCFFWGLAVLLGVVVVYTVVVLGAQSILPPGWLKSMIMGPLVFLSDLFSLEEIEDDGATARHSVAIGYRGNTLAVADSHHAPLF